MKSNLALAIVAIAVFSIVGAMLAIFLIFIDQVLP